MEVQTTVLTINCLQHVPMGVGIHVAAIVPSTSASVSVVLKVMGQLAIFTGSVMVILLMTRLVASVLMVRLVMAMLVAWLVSIVLMTRLIAIVLMTRLVAIELTVLMLCTSSTTTLTSTCASLLISRNDWLVSEIELLKAPRHIIVTEARHLLMSVMTTLLLLTTVVEVLLGLVQPIEDISLMMSLIRVVLQMSVTAPLTDFKIVLNFKLVTPLEFSRTVLFRLSLTIVEAVLLLPVLATTNLLDGSHRHELHLLEIGFVFRISHQQLLVGKTARVGLVELLELGLQLIIRSLQILDELVLSLHHNNLLVKLLLQNGTSPSLKPIFC